MNDSKKTMLFKGAGVACVLLVGFGLWKGANPSLPPLQGQAEARVIDMASKVTGRVHQVCVREGDTVTVGARLFEIDIPELRARMAQVEAKKQAASAKVRLVDDGVRREQLEAAQAQYERTLAMAELATKSYQRIKSLHAEGLISTQKYDEARANYKNAQNASKAAKSQFEMAQNGARPDERKAAHALLEEANQGLAEVTSLASDAVVTSPVNAEVSRIILNAGEIAPAGFAVLTLIDHSDKWVVFNIREDELPGIRIGTKLNARVPALAAGAQFEVYFISPRADYATWKSTRQTSGYDIRTFEVRARPVTEMKELRPGMSVIVER